MDWLESGKKVFFFKGEEGIIIVEEGIMVVENLPLDCRLGLVITFKIWEHLS